MTAPEGAGDRHHPAVRRYDVRTPAPFDASALQDFLTELLGDVDRAASVLDHGGVWCGDRHWTGEPLPADSALKIYAFTREPEGVGLPDPFVLWDDGDLVALHKPAWLPIQGTRASRRFSLEHLAARALDAPGLTAVHRLDRETSGVVLFARTGAAAARLHRQFRARTITKTYLAVVSPAAGVSVPGEPFVVRGEMTRAPHPVHARFVLTERGGSPSETWFSPVPPGRAAPASSCTDPTRMAPVLARPSTGRTHQIRVHLASRGLPLQGDTLYGPAPSAAGVGAGNGAGRLQLHALALAFHAGDRRQTVQAPTPPDLLWHLPGRPTAGLIDPAEAEEIEDLFSHVPRIALGFGR